MTLNHHNSQDNTHMQLDVIVRTCATSEHHPRDVLGRQGIRYVNASKSELVLRCVNSLLVSLAQVKNCNIILYVIDDNSDEVTVERIKILLGKHAFKTHFYALNQGGWAESMRFANKLGLEKGRELIYFVEDDYLHEPSCITEMLDDYYTFRKNLGDREVALSPFDSPDCYEPDRIEPTRIAYGKQRHWRTIHHSTSTLLITRDLLVKHWDKFMALAGAVDENTGIHEGNTINLIWRDLENGAVLFSPIPSLALHMQFNQQKDPYIDWEKWWDNSDWRKAA